MKETNANQLRLEQDYKGLEELRFTLELSERFFREVRIRSIYISHQAKALCCKWCQFSFFSQLLS